MKENENKKLFGLIGRNIPYSFSKKYFSEKFKNEHITNAEYINFDIQNIEELPEIIINNPNLTGLNVTIPYKELVLQFLDDISLQAKEIGAINTIKITKDKKLEGYNTDEYGFKNSLLSLFKSHHRKLIIDNSDKIKALILGTGGASKAIAYALKELTIPYKFVSRTKSETNFLYSDLNEQIISNHIIIINCTPLGTFPNIKSYPDIPYIFLSKEHLLFDLIYNPEETLFLKKGKEMGATIKNGYEMLVLQAEKSWQIWNQ